MQYTVGQWRVVLLVWTTTVLPNQALQLVKIEKNPGILPVKLGTAFLQQDKWSIVKTIALDGISRDISFNLQKYSEFSKMLNT
ncbi:unnamed protein product, partial [Plutella xylostella]